MVVISAGTMVVRKFVDRETNKEISVELTIRDAVFFDLLKELSGVVRRG